MPDSSLTKRALAAAIKDLMKEKPLVKISIADIVERCQMNRQSFYYHFRDKYDLVNWIFYTELITELQSRPNADEWEEMENIEHSKCYSEYKMTRTGCAGCPFGSGFEAELDTLKKYEPNLYVAVNNIFGDSYKYTRLYREFKNAKKRTN